MNGPLGKIFCEGKSEALRKDLTLDKFAKGSGMV